MQSDKTANSQQISAFKIQKLWRSYTNRKIYKYYREIIMFKCKGNPAKLLKGINPLEAQLLQSAVNCHVRFRLGGESFPPNIYYKVFSKTGVCDINAFAPRDYATLPRQINPNDRIKLNEYQKNKKDYENEGWYLRNDNNGWRPISHKMFIKTDYVELYSAKKVNFYHHKKVVRDQKYYKKQRMAKLKWLKNLYLKAKQKDEVELINNIQQAQQQDNGLVYVENLNKEIGKEIDMDSEEFQKEVNDLINWSENLNFDSYVKDWFQLSTSQNSASFVPKFVNSDPKNQ